ncbi:MAG: GNAT family N-acetyltransferase [Thermoanaerobaculia bacterium]
MDDVTYRAARFDDIDAMVEFQRLMAEETEGLTLDTGRVRKGIEIATNDPSLARYFIAEKDGRAAGMLMITYEWSDWRAAMVWWIQSVYVIADARKQGIYAGLYNHVKEIVKNDPSIGGIRLYVDKRNTRAQEVYARLGMNGDHYQVFEWMKEF